MSEARNERKELAAPSGSVPTVEEVISSFKLCGHLCKAGTNIKCALHGCQLELRINRLRYARDSRKQFSQNAEVTDGAKRNSVN
jgi:hypothetical protein